MNFSGGLADRHYALVLTAASYNRKTGMAIVCAITSRIRGGPFEVLVPSGLLPAKSGVGALSSVIVTDSVRQVDFRERECEFIAAAPRQVVEEVMGRLLTILEDD